MITLFAVMIIPDAVRAAVLRQSARRPGDAPRWARSFCELVFHIFVVVVGVLILSGAVNTSIIGANGVLNRVAEDGVLLDWFRKPHGSSAPRYRIINLIALLQVLTIILQPRRCLSAGRGLRVRRGVELLPEGARRAGAALPATTTRNTRCRSTSDSGKRDPDRTRRHDGEFCSSWPSRTCSPRRSRRSTASRFTLILFVLFHNFRTINARAEGGSNKGLEQFNLDISRQISTNESSAPARLCPGCGPRLQPPDASAIACSQKTNLRRHDIVVMTVRPSPPAPASTISATDQLFTRL